ncbi:hypothetical protein DK842_04735 [Chromobacterium phragmitis]|nr:hypothetical protein DK842_04735 [Chromobacterium phragmitis]
MLLLIVLPLSLLSGWAAAARAPLADVFEDQACAVMAAGRDCSAMGAEKAPASPHDKAKSGCGEASCASACLSLPIGSPSPGLPVFAAVGVRVFALPHMRMGPSLLPPFRPPAPVRI